MLMRVFPPEVVDSVIADVGRVEQRSRLLPARIVAYYVLGLALFPYASYEEVIRLLAASQAWSSGWSQTWPVPTKAALYKARTRLGYEPLQALYERVAVPLDSATFQGRWHTLDIDCVSLAVPDTPANFEEFGERLDGSFAAVRLLGLTELTTGAVVGASVPERRPTSAVALADRLMSKLTDGRLVLAGPQLYSAELWSRARSTGADLLWEIPPDLDPHSAIDARVIDAPQGLGSPKRLLTTIVDPELARADDLISLFAKRRKLASAFDEFRAHQDSPRIVLRSKIPEGVRQELYGFLCVHYAMRLILNRELTMTLK